jgi:hypothetical protein
VILGNICVTFPWKNSGQIVHTYPEESLSPQNFILFRQFLVFFCDENFYVYPHLLAVKGEQFWPIEMIRPSFFSKMGKVE